MAPLRLFFVKIPGGHDFIQSPIEGIGKETVAMKRMTTIQMMVLGALALGALSCGGKKDEAAVSPKTATPAGTPAPVAAPEATGQPFAELFAGVKLVRLPATEGGDAFQVVLPPQTNEDAVPNGPVELKVTQGEQTLAQGIPKALYRCPKSIRSMRFKVASLEGGVKVGLFVADPKAVPPAPVKPPSAAKNNPKIGKDGKPKVTPQTPEQAGIDMSNPGAAKGLPVGSPIPGLSADVPAGTLKGLKVPAAGERLIKESCG